MLVPALVFVCSLCVTHVKSVILDMVIMMLICACQYLPAIDLMKVGLHTMEVLMHV
jgi:hypothetical protein